MGKVLILLLTSLIVMPMCIGIVSADSVPCFGDQTCYSTKAEAILHVPSYIEPKDCFVWNDGPSGHPWSVIPGWGCAHWVAHQLGIKTGVGCYNGYSIRISDVTSGRSSHELNQARVGDIWTTTSGGHCGIVRRVECDPNTGKIKRVRVQHCSSSIGGVGYTWYNSGRIYKDYALESGCCEFSGGCYCGTLDPEVCRVCGGTWHSGKECCKTGPNKDKKCYKPGTPEDGCCEHSGGSYSGKHDPEVCKVCYNGSWYECCSDDDCQEGYICNLETHTCEEEVPEFPAGVTAVFGACMLMFFMMRRKYISK